MTDHDTKLALELRDRLIKAGGKAVLRVIVFGSRAKGTAREDSDLDIAVIVHRKSDQLLERLDDAAYQFMWDHDFLPIISLKIFNKINYDQAFNKGFSFYRQLEAEGVEI